MFRHDISPLLFKNVSSEVLSVAISFFKFIELAMYITGVIEVCNGECVFPSSVGSISEIFKPTFYCGDIVIFSYG